MNDLESLYQLIKSTSPSFGLSLDGFKEKMNDQGYVDRLRSWASNSSQDIVDEIDSLSVKKKDGTSQEEDMGSTWFPKGTSSESAGYVPPMQVQEEGVDESITIDDTPFSIEEVMTPEEVIQHRAEEYPKQKSGLVTHKDHYERLGGDVDEMLTDIVSQRVRETKEEQTEEFKKRAKRLWDEMSAFKLNWKKTRNVDDWEKGPSRVSSYESFEEFLGAMSQPVTNDRVYSRKVLNPSIGFEDDAEKSSYLNMTYLLDLSRYQFDKEVAAREEKKNEILNEEKRRLKMMAGADPFRVTEEEFKRWLSERETVGRAGANLIKRISPRRREALWQKWREAQVEMGEQLSPLDEKDKDFIEAYVKEITPNLIGKEEEEVVRILNKEYGKFGFTFEETGALDQMIVRSKQEGVSPLYVKLDPLNEEYQTKTAGKLRDYIKDNAIHSEEIVEDEERMITEKSLRAQNLRDKAMIGKDGTPSTVLFADGNYEGEDVVYPTLFPKDPNNYTQDPSDWMRLSGDAAYDEALKRGEVFKFDTPGEAASFARGAWKYVNTADVEAEKFFEDRGIDYRSMHMTYEQYESLMDRVHLIEEEGLLGKPGEIIEINPDELWKSDYEGLVTYEAKDVGGKLEASEGTQLYARVRGDIKEYYKTITDQSEVLFDDAHGNVEVRDARIAWDLHVHEKMQEKLRSEAQLNATAKNVLSGVDEESVKFFGKPLNKVDLDALDANGLDIYNELKTIQNQANVTKKFAAQEYLNADTYLDSKFDKKLTQAYKDGLAGVQAQIASGFNNGQAAEQILLLSMGLKGDIEDMDRDELMKIAAEIVTQQEEAQSYGVHGISERAATARSSSEFWNAVFESPYEYMVGLAGNSMAQMLPYGWWITGTTTATGAATGAVIGSGAYGVGALPGAITGAKWGMTTGMAVTSYAMEYTNSVLDAGRNHGYDMMNPDDVALALQDKNVWAEGKEMGLKRGIPIAAVDFLAKGLAGKVFKIGSVGTRTSRIALQTAERAIFDPAMEGLGELSAQYIAGQDMDYKEIVAEMAGGMGSNTSNMAVNGLRGFKQKSKIQLAENLVDIDKMAKEKASDKAISSWANRMQKTGQIDADMNQRIQENVGHRREAKSILETDKFNRVLAGGKTKEEARVMALLQARDELSSTTNRKEVFKGKIKAINEELAIIAETKEMAPESSMVELALEQGKKAQLSRYSIDGKLYTKKAFLGKVGAMSEEKRASKKIQVLNDPETAQQVGLKTLELDAVQKQQTKEGVLRPEKEEPTEQVGLQEVVQQLSKAGKEPEVVEQASKAGKEPEVVEQASKAGKEPEVVKAEIEAKREEAIDNPVEEPKGYANAVDEYKQTELGGSEDAKRKKDNLVKEAETEEGKAFVENAVAKLEHNDDGTITVYRSGTIQDGHNPGTTSKETAEIIASERKKQGLSSDIVEVRVQPSDISAVVPGIESEVLINVNENNRAAISKNTKEEQKTTEQLASERSAVEKELEKTELALKNSNEAIEKGEGSMLPAIIENKPKLERKVTNLKWQLEKYDTKAKEQGKREKVKAFRTEGIEFGAYTAHRGTGKYYSLDTPFTQGKKGEKVSEVELDIDRSKVLDLTETQETDVESKDWKEYKSIVEEAAKRKKPLNLEGAKTQEDINKRMSEDQRELFDLIRDVALERGYEGVISYIEPGAPNVNTMKEIGREYVDYTEGKKAKQEDKETPQFHLKDEDTPSYAGEASVLITPATVRSFDNTTERLKGLSLTFDKKTKEFDKEKSKRKRKKIFNELKEIEKQILDDARKEIISAIEKIDGVAVEFEDNALGLWDGSFEPSFTMKLLIAPDANTEAASSVLFDFAEKYSQDAFIVEQNSEEYNSDYQEGKIEVPLSVKDGKYLHYPQVNINFDKELTPEEKAKMSNSLQENGVDSFSLTPTGLKVSITTHLSEEQSQLPLEQQKKIKLKDYEQITEGIAKSKADVFGNDKGFESEIIIKRSSYNGAINEYTEDQTRQYDRSDVLKGFSRQEKGVEEAAVQAAKLRSKQISLQEAGKDLSAAERRKLRKLNKITLPALLSTFKANQSRYKQAKIDVEAIAGKAIEGTDATLSPFGIKKPERASVKTQRWHSGFNQDLGDGARVNIVVKKDSDVEAVFETLKKDNPKGNDSLRRLMEVTGLGFPKTLVEVKTPNGMIAEIQVITEAAYLAKDGVGGFTGDQSQKKSAKKKLKEIRKRLGWDIPDGLGHYFYEIHRDVNIDQALKNKAESLSKKYYGAFAGQKLNESFMEEAKSFMQEVDAADKKSWDKGNKGVAPKSLSEYRVPPVGRTKRKKAAASKDIDVEKVRTSGRPGKKVSKGLSKKGTKAPVISETENLSLEYVKEKNPDTKKKDNLFIKNARVIASYPLVRGVKKIDKIETVEQAQEVYDIFVRQAADNLNFLIKNFNPELVETSSLWYDGANKIANELAEKYGVTSEQVAGIMASLSPQQDWYINVRLTEMVLEAYAENPEMTTDMVEYQKGIDNRSLYENQESPGKRLKKAKAKYRKSRSKKNLAAVKKAEKSLNDKIEKTDAVIKLLESYVGKPMDKVPVDIQTYMIRLYHEVNTSTDYNIITPDGRKSSIARNKPKKEGLIGEKAKVAWGSYTEIGKAASIYSNGSQENISRSLGMEHKIRNFYNNIIDPMSLDNDVTIDTHAVGAAFFKAVSSSSKEVDHNFGKGGASSSAPDGIKGIYYAIAEAYVLAAKENNLLPRQVQSITWEAVRGLYPRTWKTKENVSDINEIWNDYEEGKISIEEARDLAVKKAGGIQDPSWAGGPLQEELREGVQEEGDGRRGDRDGQDTIGDELKLQIIGESAQLTQNVRGNLQVARDMEGDGEGVKSTRRATGWERGADREWKYEIEDVSIPESFNYKSLKRIPSGAYSGLLSDVVSDNDVFKSYSKPFRRESQMYNEDGTVWEGAFRYDNYPSLKDVRVYFREGYNPSYGEFDPVGKSITVFIQPGNSTNEQISITLTHEIQHYIQGREGFASGSPSSLELYDKSAAEVEARNAEKRRGMAPEQRRETTLEETEDVAREDQLLFFGDELKLQKQDESNYERFVSVLRQSFPSVEVVSTQKEFDKILKNIASKGLTTKDKKVYGAVYKGKMYLNPSLENYNTPIHEFGHVWMNTAKETNPELYNKGISLIKDSDYVQKVKRSKSYQRIVEQMREDGASQEKIDAYILEEALATAIGDRGESFVNAAQKKNFRAWLTSLYDYIRKITGISKYTTEQLQDITMDEFLDAVSADLLSGEALFEGKAASIDTDLQLHMVGESAKLSQEVMDNLDRARQMEASGLGEDEIWHATGWERGTEGKWKYEISPNKIYADVVELNVARAFEVFHDPVERRDRRVGNVPYTEVRLGDLISNPKLFEAYPELAEANVELGVNEDHVFDRKDISISAQINVSTRDIKLFLPKGFDDALSSKDRSVAMAQLAASLTHEVQHWIQEEEGFATGTSSKHSQWLVAQAVNEASDLILSKASMVEGRVGSSLKVKEKVSDIMDRTFDKMKPLLTKLQVDALKGPMAYRAAVTFLKMSALSDARKSLQALERSITRESGEDVSRDFRQITAMIERVFTAGAALDTLTALQLYERAAGEVEANNVMARLFMSPQKRKARRPERTEEISRDDQILLGQVRRFMDIIKSEAGGKMPKGDPRSVIAEAQRKGLTNEVIRDVLIAQGFDEVVVNSYLDVQLDMFAEAPSSFDRVEGGAIKGLELFQDVKTKLDNYANRKGEKTKKKPTPEMIRKRAMDLMMNNSIWKAQPENIQAELLVAFDQLLGIKVNETVDMQITKLKNMVTPPLDMKQVKKNFKKVIKGLGIPKELRSKAQVGQLVTLINNLTEKNYTESIKRAAEIIDVMLEKQLTQQQKANKRLAAEKARADSRLDKLKAQLDEYKMKAAAAVMNQKQIIYGKTLLSTLIKTTLPKGELTTSEVKGLLTRIQEAKSSKSFMVEAEKAVKLIEKIKNRLKKQKIKEIASLIKEISKLKVTQSGKIRTKGRVDARTHEYFGNLIPVVNTMRGVSPYKNKKLVKNKKGIQESWDSMDDLKDYLSSERTLELIDKIESKLINGEVITPKEQAILDLRDGVNLLGDVDLASLEDVQSILNDLKDLKDVGRSFLSEKLNREREDRKRLRLEANEGISKSMPFLFIEEGGMASATITVDSNADGLYIKSVTFFNKKGQVVKRHSGGGYSDGLFHNNRHVFQQIIENQKTSDFERQVMTQALEKYNQILSKEPMTQEDISRIEELRDIGILDENETAELEALESLLEAEQTIEVENEALVPRNEDQLVRNKTSISEDLKKLKVWSALKNWGRAYKGMDTPKKALEFFRNRLSTLETLCNILDRKGTWFRDNVYRPLNRMEEARLANTQKQEKIIEGIARSVGVKKIAKLQRKVSKKRMTFLVRGEEAVLNGNDMMRLIALSRNEVQMAKLEAMGITALEISQMEGIVGPQAVAFVDAIVGYLSTEYYDQINKVYRDTHNINMPYVENYFPTETLTASPKGSDFILEGNFGKAFEADAASALKQRTDKTSDIRIETADGFFGTLSTHIESMERFKAYAQGTNKLQTVWKTKAVQTALAATNLNRIMGQTIALSINPEGIPSVPAKMAVWLQTAYTGYALAWKTIQILKQASSFIQAMPYFTVQPNLKVKVPGVDLLAFTLSHAGMILRLASPMKTGPLANPIYKAASISATFRDRLKKGFKGDLETLVSGIVNSRTRQPGWKKNRFRRGVRIAAGGPTVIGDILGVIGYMNVYEQNIRNGMSKEEALEKFNDYSSTQQTRRGTERVGIQQPTGESGEFKRVFAAFGSTLFLQLNKVAQTSTNISRAIRDGKLPKKSDINSLIINYAVANMLFLASANIMKLTRGDDEDKEEVWARMKEAMFGLTILFKMPFLGGAIEGAYKEWQGERAFGAVGVNPAVSVWKDASKAIKNEDALTGAKVAGELIMGMQFDVPAASAKALFDQDYSQENMQDLLGLSTSYRVEEPESYVKEFHPLSDEELKKQNPEAYRRRKKKEADKKRKNAPKEREKARREQARKREKARRDR